MIVFKFESEEGDYGVSVVSKGVLLSDVMQDFRLFLLATGYHSESVDDYIEAK